MFVVEDGVAEVCQASFCIGLLEILVSLLGKRSGLPFREFKGFKIVEIDGLSLGRDVCQSQWESLRRKGMTANLSLNGGIIFSHSLRLVGDILSWRGVKWGSEIVHQTDSVSCTRVFCPTCDIH